jgi:predicted peroxiredoxin
MKDDDSDPGMVRTLVLVVLLLFLLLLPLLLLSAAPSSAQGSSALTGRLEDRDYGRISRPDRARVPSYKTAGENAPRATQPDVSFDSNFFLTNDSAFFSAGDTTASTSPAAGATTDSVGAGKKVVIRLRRYRILSEQEVVWEALYLANQMAEQGTDVSLLLELEAVNAANRHDVTANEFEPHRGVGYNAAGGKPIRTTALMQKLISLGGKVYASERWAQIYALTGPNSQLVPGVRLMSDSSLARFLADNARYLLTY